MSEFAELAKAGQLQGILFLFACVLGFAGYVIFQLWAQNQNLWKVNADVLKKNGELATEIAMLKAEKDTNLILIQNLKTQVDQLQDLVTKFVGKNFNPNAN